MAKKKDKERPPGASDPKSRAEQVRAAVEQAFGATAQGAGPVRERAQDLADELAGVASRVREALEELRPPTGDELATLRARVEALERRVAELEGARGTAATTTKPRPTRATRASAGGAKGASASPGASSAKRATTARQPRSARTDTES
jgi:polyhydroxyalkanoate synthesis regulator phasin